MTQATQLLTVKLGFAPLPSSLFQLPSLHTWLLCLTKYPRTMDKKELAARKPQLWSFACRGPAEIAFQKSFSTSQSSSQSSQGSFRNCRCPESQTPGSEWFSQCVRTVRDILPHPAPKQVTGCHYLPQQLSLTPSGGLRSVFPYVELKLPYPSLPSLAQIWTP